jgi:hypothetical protein
MNAMRYFGFLFLGLVALIGCTKSTESPKGEPNQVPAKAAKEQNEEETKIQVALAKLSDADRPLALAQKFCPIQKTRLGTMGKPDRIELNCRPVFLCCSGCEDDARADPKKTLDQVEQFKKASK